MSDFELNTPVLFLIFNRPDTEQLVFNEIRKAKPKQLFVAADGPRANKPGEKRKCAQARAIIDQVDWECEVKTLYRDSNLGCKVAVSSAIDWFFDNVEEGIILEDDCLPDQSFFRFCQEMLGYFSEDQQMMQVSGTNPMKMTGIKSDFFFARFSSIWGWATWKRAWKKYDVEMTVWPEVRMYYDKILGIRKNALKSRIEAMDKVYSGQINTWDYQWALSKEIYNGLSIIPSVNMVTNLGFGPEATHTKSPQIDIVNSGQLDWPLSYPCNTYRNKTYDKDYFNQKCKKSFIRSVFRVYKRRLLRFRNVER